MKINSQGNSQGNSQVNSQGNSQDITRDTAIDTLANGMSDYRACIASAVEGGVHTVPETFDDLIDRLAYRENQRFYKTDTHNGQCKLLAGEIQFLTKHVGKEDPADARLSVVVDALPPTHLYTHLCVYAGAAPTTKHPILCAKFPRVKFLLVDPVKFNFKGVPRDAASTDSCAILTSGGFSRDGRPLSTGNYDAAEVFKRALTSPEQTVIINDYFTNALADTIGEQFPGVLFISDVRTNTVGSGDRNLDRNSGAHSATHSTENDNPDAVDILWNYAQQFNWVRKMKSRANMTKFRHPFYADSQTTVLKSFALHASEYDLAKTTINDIPGIDFEANYRARSLTWFDGTIALQVFAPKSSTETRLCFDGRNIRDWGTMDDYENAFFAHNNTARNFRLYCNPNADPSIHFDRCFDCAGLNKILCDHREKFQCGGTVADDIRAITSCIGRNFGIGDHGKFPINGPVSVTKKIEHGAAQGRATRHHPKKHRGGSRLVTRTNPF